MVAAGRRDDARSADLSLAGLAIGFAVLLFAIYGPLARAGFVVDYIGWKERVEAGGFVGALTTYGFPAHLPLYALFMWGFEKLRLVSPWLVEATLCLLGGIAAASLARLVATEVARCGSTAPLLTGVLAGLLWAVAPGGTELFVLKVCPHYLLSGIYWTAGLYHFGRYLDRARRRDLVLVLVLQALGLVSLELAYGYPLALVAFGLWRLAVPAAHRPAWRRLAVAVLGSLGLVALHLAATRLTYGAWVGHYGAEVATALPVAEVLAAPWRWLARALLYARYWSYDARVALASALATPVCLLALYAAAALAAAVVARQRIRGRRSASHAVVLWGALAGIAAAPVAPMYFFDLQWVEGDRLGALLTMFAVAAASTALGLLGRGGLLVGGGALLTCSGYLLSGPWRAWATADSVIDGLAASARAWREANPHPDTVLLVGYVGNVRGAYALSDLQPRRSGLGSHLEAFYGEVDWPYFIEVAQFNQQTLADSVNQEWGNDRLYVSLGAPGAWWWRKQLGLTSYADTVHRLRVDKYEHHFEIHFDDPSRPPLPAWYQVGTHLRSITVPPTNREAPPAGQ